MLELRSSPLGFKWRRTAFARIDGAVAREKLQRNARKRKLGKLHPWYSI